jgi:hypothetical protein
MGTPVRGSPDGIRVIASNGMVLPATSGVFSELISIVFMVGGLTIMVVNPGFPPTIAPAITLPGPTSLMFPFSSAAAASNGPAK